jgi:2-oxoglutarate ferredoxin oxidoreductase subunit beta
MEGTVTKNQPFGVMSEQFNPMAFAVAMDCSFAGRSFAGDHDHLKMMIMEAITHKGFSLVDILQPCVTFNKTNTFAWYRQRVYHIEPGYDPYNRVAAFARALEWGEKIPLGVIYRNTRPTLEERFPVIRERPLVRQSFDITKIAATIREFL